MSGSLATGSHSLSMSLHETFDDDVATIIQRHTEQLKGLERTVHNRNTLILPKRIYPILDSGENYPILDSEILDFLRLTPNLVECTFNRVYVDLALQDPPRLAFQIPPGLALPNPRHLRFGRIEERVDSGDATIIKYLSLPALQPSIFPYTPATSPILTSS
ncbi:hypothetical protein DFH09DRAFT_135147 [Mycena vulgaris]|nr:hypothetical protein DFH09DRAFT_135147 [Mycena vulgaris]